MDTALLWYEAHKEDRATLLAKPISVKKQHLLTGL